MIDDDELSDGLDSVPADWRLLQGLNSGQVVVLDEDGVGPASLALVPSMFAIANERED